MESGSAIIAISTDRSIIRILSLFILSSMPFFFMTIFIYVASDLTIIYWNPTRGSLSYDRAERSLRAVLADHFYVTGSDLPGSSSLEIERCRSVAKELPALAVAQGEM